MRQLASTLILASVLVLPALSQKKSNPLVGRWDFTITAPTGTRANWLSVTEKPGGFDVWFQPTGGHVIQMKDAKVDGSHLTFTLPQGSAKGSPTTWELDVSDDKLTGAQKHDSSSIPLTGLRAPDLKRNPPNAWANPEPLFNGKSLSGWEPVGDVANNHWVVKDGLLVNQDHGANLKTTRKFDDFMLHFEANCPDGANSGFYLRGRYELQLEYEPADANPVERRMGSIYGRIAPKVELPHKPGEWDTFDVTLVGRTITVVRNGVITINKREIEGITGGALDANEGEPGPFYIQGDHTGGLKFRNITVSVPKL
jgi:hypothetical protein